MTPTKHFKTDSKSMVYKKSSFFSDTHFVFLIGALIGATLFLYIFGIDKLDCTNISWLMPKDNGDLTQHYLGWIHYRKSSWHFPIGLIDGIVYPHLISVIFTDSIPLFAVFFKLLSPILPENFQYFGLFGLICYILQGGFSAIFVYHYTKKKAPSIISSAFFSGSLLMMWRMFYHTALAAHWIIIASLYLWFCVDKNLTASKSAFKWSLLSIIALLTEAYFLPVVWACLLCDLFSQLLYKSWEKPLTVLVCSIVSTLITGWVIGLFYGNVSASNPIGFGLISFNLNGFINSQGYSILFPALPLLPNGLQVEGLAYLGAGIFGLIAFNIFIYLRKIKSHAKRKINFRKTLPIIIFIAGLTLLSLSNTITLGSYSITIALPATITNLWSIFRSTARLIWPVYYLIMLFSCIGAINNVKSNELAIIVISSMLALQLYDLSGAITEKKANFDFRNSSTYVSELSDPEWEDIVADGYKHIMFYPSVISLYNNQISYEFQAFALKNNLTLNCIYLSRNVINTVDSETYNYFSDLSNIESNQNTFYVFLDKLPNQSYNLYFYKLNGLIIGTPRKLANRTSIPVDELN